MKVLSKWLHRAAAAAMALVFLTAPAFAGEQATREECMEKCRTAAKLMESAGIDAALEKINEKNGPFVWKDSYVFCLDLEKQSNAAHPVNPALIGKNLMMVKDVKGKMFVAEFINVAVNQGEGWVGYMWPKPGEKDPSPKQTYVLKVSGKPYAMLAGIYE